MPTIASRVVAVALSSALIWLSPGFGAIEAYAQVSNAAVSAPVAPSVVVGVAPGVAAIGGNAASVKLSRAAQSVPLTMPVPVVGAGLRTLSSASMPVSGTRGQTALSGRVAAGNAVTATGVSSRAGALASAENSGVREVARISNGVGEALKAAGSVRDASPTQAASLGFQLQKIVSGERATATAGSDVAPQGFSMGESHGMSLGKAAGWDSIHRAVQSGGPSTPVPPSNKDDGRGGFGGGEKPPFFARVIASAMALAPAAYFGWPLVAAGAWVPGGLLVAAGLGLAAMPWLKPATSNAVLAAPGVVIAVLGAVTALTTAGWGMAVGGLVVLSGWGFERFSRGFRKNPSATEQMSAIFGALSATAAAGFVLTGSAGFVAAGLTGLFSLFALRLLAELPEWTYEGVGQIFRGAWKGLEGTHQVLGSIRKDTVLYDRLGRLTERQVKQFGWFSWIWLAGLWAPVLASEAIMLTLTLAAALYLAVIQAPILFAWGAFNEVKDKGAFRSRMAVRFANWEKETFAWLQGSKTTFFNRFEKMVLPYANSKSRPVSLVGGLVIRVGHLGWLVYAAVGGVIVPIVTGIRAFLGDAEPYDAAKHSLSSLRVPHDPLPSEKPKEDDDQTGPEKNPFFPRLIAAGVALIPMYFFGLPLLMLGGASIATLPYLGAGVIVALLPLMPQSTPTWLRAVPGGALAAAGAIAAVAGAPVIGTLAALAGWGLGNFALKMAEKDRYYHVTDPEYVGAFFGALGSITALGVALTGMPGVVGLALQIGGVAVSGFAGAHIPRFFFSGLYIALNELARAPARVHKVMNFWDDTKFDSNLKQWWKSWGDKSPWHWWWMWPSMAFQLLFQAYDAVVSAVAGVALAAVRSPVMFAWGAAYKISRNHPATRFIAGAGKSLIENAEGNKALFDKWVSPLVPGIERPSIGALLPLSLARVVQLVWLARIVVTSPWILIKAGYDGYQAYKAGPPADGEADKLSPSYL